MGKKKMGRLSHQRITIRSMSLSFNDKILKRDSQDVEGILGDTDISKVRGKKLVYEKREIDSLKFDPKNARKHDNKNIDAIKGSLTKFGQQKPIVIDKNNVIVAGNGTVMAAKDLGWEHVNVVISELDSTHLKAYALADNKSSELAVWDDTILKETLASLSLLDFNIEDIGFELSDMDFEIGLDEDTVKDKTAGFKIQITFNNENEMMLKYEELISQGLIVKVVMNG